MSELRADKIEQTLTEIEARIDRLDPNGPAANDDKWRERKSARTRLAILTAAVDRLAREGYAQTSTQLVAAEADVSRGAMLHHYATKLALMEGVLDYVLAEHMRAFCKEVRKLSEEERVVEGAGVEVLWKLMKTPEYAATMELKMASRTDAKLGAIFEARMRAYEKELFKTLPLIFPEWADATQDELQLARDVIFVTLNGLFLSLPVMPQRKRRAALRKFIFDAVQHIKS